MGERRRNQVDQGRARLLEHARPPAELTLSGDIQILSHAGRDIGEAGEILLGGVEYLHDGGGRIGVHAQHLGGNGHLHVAHLSAGHSRGN